MNPTPEQLTRAADLAPRWRSTTMREHYEIEEDRLQQDYASGLLTLEEYNRAMLELQREACEAAEEAAYEAYQRELDRW